MKMIHHSGIGENKLAILIRNINFTQIYAYIHRS